MITLNKFLLISLTVAGFSCGLATRASAGCNPPYGDVSDCCTNFVSTNCIAYASLTQASIDQGGCFCLMPGAKLQIVANAMASVSNGTANVETTQQGGSNCTNKWVVPLSICPVPQFNWTVSGPDCSTNGTGKYATAEVTTAGVYTVSFVVSVTGQCVNASSMTVFTNVVVLGPPVVDCMPWLGLDRTDEGTNQYGQGQTGYAGCPGTEPNFKWELTGACVPADGAPTNGVGVRSLSFRTSNKEACSAKYLGDKVSVMATPPDCQGYTNFTVVKLDVTIDDVEENKEETEGAFLEYVADTNGVMTVDGTNFVKGVSIRCWPEDLPTNEMVSISVPSESLFEKIDNILVPAKSEYRACEVSSKQFFLHGHAVSGSLHDQIIEVKHSTSKAIDKAKYTVFNVVFPCDAEPSKNNNIYWWLNGISESRFSIQPDPQEAGATWEVRGFPGDSATEIKWTSPGALSGQNYEDWFGYGATPSLAVKYISLTPEFQDVMPPDNSWFGKKEVVVTIGDKLVISRPVWVYFPAFATKRIRVCDNKEISTWFYYWVKGDAVPRLGWFEYVDSLGSGVQARHHPSPLMDCTFQIAYCASTGTYKPVYTVDPPSYTETGYLSKIQGKGIHGVAKLCLHELWHHLLHLEVGLNVGYWNDYDGDGLSDERELEIGTLLHVKDSVNLCGYKSDYGDYAEYADEELFCRIYQEAASGTEANDWSAPGTQTMSFNPLILD